MTEQAVIDFGSRSIKVYAFNGQELKTVFTHNWEPILCIPTAEDLRGVLADIKRVVPQATAIATRYSVDDVSCWENGFKNIKYLKKAYDFFKSLVYEGSPFYKEILLGRGEMLIMANSRISHGRTAYVDTEKSQRKMYRALFEKYPVHEQ